MKILRRNIHVHLTRFQTPDKGFYYNIDNLRRFINDTKYHTYRANLLVNWSNSSSSSSNRTCILIGNEYMQMIYDTINSLNVNKVPMEIFVVGKKNPDRDDTFMYTRKDNLISFFSSGKSNAYTAIHVLGGISLIESVLSHFPSLIKILYLTDIEHNNGVYINSKNLDNLIAEQCKSASLRQVILTNNIIPPNFTYFKIICEYNNPYIVAFKPLKCLMDSDVQFSNYNVSQIYNQLDKGADHDYQIANFLFQFKFEQLTGTQYYLRLPNIGPYDPLVENDKQLESLFNGHDICNNYIDHAEIIEHKTIIEQSDELDVFYTLYNNDGKKNQDNCTFRQKSDSLTVWYRLSQTNITDIIVKLYKTICLHLHMLKIKQVQQKLIVHFSVLDPNIYTLDVVNKTVHLNCPERFLIYDSLSVPIRYSISSDHRFTDHKYK